MHHNNVSAESPVEYYRRAVAIPIVDQFIAEMTFIFNSFNKTASKLLLLVPSIIWDQEYNNLDIEGSVEQNSDVLPNPDVIDLEPKLWKKKWSEVKKEDCSASLAKTIKHCDKVSKCFYFDKDWFHLASYLSRVRPELFRHEKIENMVKIYNEIRSPQFIGNNEYT